MKNRDNRIRKSADEVRSSRSMEENASIANGMSPLETQEDKRTPFMDEFNFEALPDMGKTGDPNFHYFWATTTNSQDSPHRRMRMGYILVKAEELPDYQHLRMKSGEFEGVISMNEMILMKIPTALYQRYMMEVHHNRPNQEETKLKANARLGHVDKNGKPLDTDVNEDEGFREMGKYRPRPISFE